MSAQLGNSTGAGAPGLLAPMGHCPWNYTACCRQLVVGCLCEVCALFALHYAQAALCEELEEEIRQAWKQLRRLALGEGGRKETDQAWDQLWRLQRQLRKAERKRRKSYTAAQRQYCARGTT